MIKINVCLFRDPPEQLSFRGIGQGVPSHVRDLQYSVRIRYPQDLSLPQSQAPDPGRFLALLKEHLQAQADPEDRQSSVIRLIQDIIVNARVYGERIKGAAYALYRFGRIGEGDGSATLVFAQVAGRESVPAASGITSRRFPTWRRRFAVFFAR